MLREVSVRSIVGFLVVLSMVCAVPAEGRQGGGTAGASNPGLPMFFDVDWTQPASQDGQTKLVQENIGDANLNLMQYGLHESCLLTSGVPGSETRPFSAWSGECESPFATMFRHKTAYVDLTGAAKIRWAVKTSGVPCGSTGGEAGRRHDARGRHRCRVGPDAAPERGSGRRDPLGDAGSGAGWSRWAVGAARSTPSGCRSRISAAWTKSGSLT